MSVKHVSFKPAGGAGIVGDILIFEAPTNHDVPFIKAFLRQSSDVRAFDLEMNLKRHAKLKPFLLSSQLQRIFLVSHSKVYAEAIEAANAYAPEIVKSAQFSALKDLYGSEDVLYIFKKFIVEEILGFSYMQRYLADVASRNPDKTILFACVNFLDRGKLYEKYLPKIHMPSNVKILPAVSVWARIKRSWEPKCLAGAYALVTGCFAFWGGIFSFAKPERISCPYAVWVGSRFEVEHAGDRGYDILIDQKEFRNDNMLFIDATGLEAGILSRERAKGRHFFELKKSMHPFVLMRKRWQIGFLRKAAVCLGRSFWQPPLSEAWSKAYLTIIKAYFDWAILAQSVNIKNLISTNQEHARMSCVHILLRVAGGVSWNYSCYLGGGYILARGNDLESVKNTAWAFLVYDNFVGFNEDVISYNRSHSQRALAYHAVGSLFSQPAVLKQNAREELLREYFHLPSGVSDKKIVAVFDTTFIDVKDALTNYEDCLAFYEDMMRLLSARQDLLFVVKPSKGLTMYCYPDHPLSSPEKGAKIAAAWQQMSAHPRVAWMSDLQLKPKNVLNFSFNSLILAGSDIVITHCMSSPTAEALGARKKAFWYESGDKHAGTDYDKIPGLIVHGYEALRARVDALLDGASKEAYEAYLDKYIRGKIDAYADGRALDRFRSLLRQG